MQTVSVIQIHICYSEWSHKAQTQKATVYDCQLTINNGRRSCDHVDHQNETASDWWKRLDQVAAVYFSRSPDNTYSKKYQPPDQALAVRTLNQFLGLSFWVGETHSYELLGKNLVE